jgi:hypothetical protein
MYITLSDNSQLPHPVHSFIVLMQPIQLTVHPPTHPPTHMQSGIAEGSEEQLSDKTAILQNTV